MRKACNNVLEAIGDTPLIKLNDTVKDLPCKVYIKMEISNPGGSVKDHMGLKMVMDAIESGRLKPGGTVIESTSGNTGMGIALACAVLKYKCLLVVKDKTSKEKVDILKAYGAEVMLCPSNVDADDPSSGQNVAERLSREIPNSVYLNQYENCSNPLAYYESVGPEIWEQTEGRVTHFVAAAGTGGTLMGIGRYLKEKNPKLKVWAVEPFGSMLKRVHETGSPDDSDIYPYAVEGFGQNFLPGLYDMSLIDEFFKLTDLECTLAARDLLRDEGICVGFSTGAQLACIRNNKDRFDSEDVVVLIVHDSGTKYLSKIFNDDWVAQLK